jgi:integrase/recombinase XerD
MAKEKILSRDAIRNIEQVLIKHCPDSLDLKALCRMAETNRQHEQSKIRAKNRKPKKYLKPTDYLSVEQFAKIMQHVISAAEVSRSKTGTLTRAITNEMIVIVLSETGLRASELVNLKLSDLPSHHGKNEIEVIDGKGNKDRTIGISSWLRSRLEEFVRRYHVGHPISAPLFRSEQGSVLSYNSVYAKVKNIGISANVWTYISRGEKTSRLSPHKFRHTYATLLMDVTDNEFLVQSQLGHEDPVTTAIYARTLSEKMRHAMDNYHGRLWSGVDEIDTKNTTTCKKMQANIKVSAK